MKNLLFCFCLTLSCCSIANYDSLNVKGEPKCLHYTVAVQPPRKVTLSRLDRASFVEAMASLHRQSGKTFVVEGVPLHPILDSKQLSALENLPFDDVVQKVADDYDYFAEHSGTVYTFSKRYTDGQDVPSVTIEECRFMIRNMYKVISLFNPRYFQAKPRPDGTDPFVADFAATVTPAQNAALLSDQGLAVSELPMAQQEYVRQFVYHFFVEEPMLPLSSAERGLDSAPTATISAEKSRGLFGYSSGNNFQMLDSRRNFELLNPGQEPFDETKHLKLFVAVKSVRTSKNYFLLGDFVRQLNHDTNTRFYAVQDCLRSKEIMVFGSSMANPDDLMTALSHLYGLWRVVTVDPTTGRSTSSLSLPIVQPVRVIEDVSTAVQNTIPLPLQRAISAEPKPTAIGTRHQPPDNEQAPQEFMRTLANMQKMQNRQRRGREMAQEAATRLQALYDLHTKRSKLPLFVHDLQAADQNLLAVALVGSWLPMPHDEVPWYITHFDELILNGGEYDDQDGHWFGLLVYKPATDKQKKMVQFGSAGFHYNPRRK